MKLEVDSSVIQAINIDNFLKGVNPQPKPDPKLEETKAYVDNYLRYGVIGNGSVNTVVSAIDPGPYARVSEWAGPPPPDPVKSDDTGLTVMLVAVLAILYVS